MLNVPPLPFAFSGLWADFLTLDPRRPTAMSGISALPITEIVAYGNALHGGYTSLEVETLIGLDNMRLRIATAKDEELH